MQGVPQLTHARAAIYTAARLRILSPPVDFPIFRYFAPDQGALVNKNELIDAVAAATGLTKADAEKALEAVFDSIGDALKKGLEVRLVGFGTFSVTKRAASEGRNPRTGEKIQIPASKLPKFRAGKGLKEAVQ
jgi:DNA-binding protein HU-beta